MNRLTCRTTNGCRPPVLSIGIITCLTSPGIANSRNLACISRCE